MFSDDYASSVTIVAAQSRDWCRDIYGASEVRFKNTTVISSPNEAWPTCDWTAVIIVSMILPAESVR